MAERVGHSSVSATIRQISHLQKLLHTSVVPLCSGAKGGLLVRVHIDPPVASNAPLPVRVVAAFNNRVPRGFRTGLFSSQTPRR